MLSVLFVCVIAAADWLSASADPRHTRSQPAEQELSFATVGGLKLLWKFNFEERITAPVVLGPIFTHRGIKELVFVAGAQNNLYSVDADLGRLFWKRHFDVPASDCKTGLTAAPVLAPYNGPPPEGDDASTPRRSLFVLTSDGQLHTVRPADAKDLTVPEKFLTPGSIASDLTLTSRVISTYVSGGCGARPTGEYSLTLSGAIRLVMSTAPPEPKAAVWQGIRIAASGGSLAAVERDHPLWVLADLADPIPPVAANGLVFTVIGTKLLALEIASGNQVFESAANGTEPAQDSLAVANGHIYFVAGKTLYCYGFPIEI